RKSLVRLHYLAVRRRATLLLPPDMRVERRQWATWMRGAAGLRSELASADGCSNMTHLDIPGTRGGGECTMRRGRLGRGSGRGNVCQWGPAGAIGRFRRAR